MDLSNENVIHIKKENIEYIQFRKLLKYSDILVHAFSVGKEVDFRTSKEENYSNAIRDYENLCKSLKIDKTNIIKPNQTHSDKIEIVNEKINIKKPDINIEKYEKTDGLITNKKNKILATTSADCILMLFFDPITKVIANVHSGWKGTYQEIAIKTIEKLENKYNVNPKNLICCMCPSIRKCHFEVKSDVKELFYEKFKNLKEIKEIIEKTNSKEEKWKIDTIKLNKILLREKGLKEENIIDSKICTVCNNEKLHSYRIEKEKYKLETAIISLK